MGLAEQTLLYNAKSGRCSSEDGSIGYFYVSPARAVYPHQWLWDSCFHAITMAHFDSGLAQAELRSLISNIRPDGLIPHVIPWEARSDETAPGRVKAWCLSFSPFSNLIQPPVLAVAMREVYRRSGNDPFLKEVLPATKLHYRYFADHRDPDGDGLVSIINPVESGMDHLPTYDAALNLEGPSAARYHLAMAGISLRHLVSGWNMDRIFRDDAFCVEDVGFNSIYADGLWSLAELCDLAGDPDAEEFRRLARRTERAIIEKCYDPEKGLFYGGLHSGNETPLSVSTVASLLPLLLRELPAGIAERLVDRHLTNTRTFWLPYPVPSVSAAEPHFDPESPRLHRNGGFLSRLNRSRHKHRMVWRGPSWINVNWLIARGLRIHGFAGVADALAYKTEEMVAREGFWEYYHPYTGAGQGAEGQSWSTLVVDMLHDCGKTTPAAVGAQTDDRKELVGSAL